MARIRTIKPEFPHSESIGALSRDARLLFIQLWTLVDDEGRARAASRMLASLLYPYDDDAPDLMPGWLTELEQRGLIRVYDVECSRYLEIANWLKHQKIDHPSKSRLPECPPDFAKPREPSRSLAPDLGPRTSTKDQDSRTVAKATRPKTSEAFEEFWKAYPRRLGANPKAPAFKKFSAAVGQGADPAAIIEGARRCAVEDHDKIGTPYIPQAVKWLGDQRWADYAAAPPGSSGLSDEERKAMFEKLRKPNEQRAGTDLRGTGSSPRKIEGIRGEEPTSHANNQARNTGMASLGAILREPLGVRASGDETCPTGDEPGVHRPG